MLLPGAGVHAVEGARVARVDHLERAQHEPRVRLGQLRRVAEVRAVAAPRVEAVEAGRRDVPVRAGRRTSAYSTSAPFAVYLSGKILVLATS